MQYSDLLSRLTSGRLMQISLIFLAVSTRLARAAAARRPFGLINFLLAGFCLWGHRCALTALLVAPVALAIPPCCCCGGASAGLYGGGLRSIVVTARNIGDPDLIVGALGSGPPECRSARPDQALSVRQQSGGQTTASCLADYRSMRWAWPSPRFST